ncbi:hypothetical protein R1sor_021452 [Riccia sorocarpa]|uniref:Uncharacterized protein n=1 Tax=Riccia sorocarpa TaxID=122646 RepID=A0ABD3GIR6_9MARC
MTASSSEVAASGVIALVSSSGKYVALQSSATVSVCFDSSRNIPNANNPLSLPELGQRMIEPAYQGCAVLVDNTAFSETAHSRAKLGARPEGVF